MKIIKNVSKNKMSKSMQKEAKKAYSACSNDCPKCRVSDG